MAVMVVVEVVDEGMVVRAAAVFRVVAARLGRNDDERNDRGGGANAPTMANRESNEKRRIQQSI